MTNPAESVEKDVCETLGEVFRALIECDRAQEFIYAMQRRAEAVTRSFATTPPDNRDMAMGQISICYELADGAKAALDAAISEAKERAADRIRKEAEATQ